jgi:hypothetical protein
MAMTDTDIQAEVEKRAAERKKRDEELLALLLLFLLGWAEDEAVVALGKMLPSVPGELAAQAGRLAGERVTTMAATMTKLINDSTDRVASELVGMGLDWDTALRTANEAAAGLRTDRIAEDQAYKARIVGQFAAADVLREAVESGALADVAYPVKWRWRAYPGACGICAELNGQVFEFDADMEKSGIAVTPAGDTPGMVHPSCRCVVEYILSDDREVSMD